MRDNIKEKKGFTLTELIIVIAIIGILAAVISIKMVDVVNDAQTTICVTNMTQVQRMYAGQSALLGFNVSDSETVLKKVIDSYGTSLKYVEEATYLAPCKGTCTVEYAPDGAIIVEIVCSKHGKLSIGGGMADNRTPIQKAEDAAKKFAESKTTLDALAKYLKNAKDAIDSTGPNQAPEVNACLQALGLNTEDCGWRVWTEDGKVKYEIYWTDSNLAEYTDYATPVRFVKYTYNAGTVSAPQSGTCKVSTKNVSKADGTKVTINVLAPGDAANTKYDAVYGESWK